MGNLHVPIFSMRSYQTGAYDISKDGNFQLHLARIQPGDHVVIPDHSTGMEDLENMGFDFFDSITFVKVKYGVNAVETRRKFWEYNYHLDDYAINNGLKAIVTDITGYKGYLTFYNNFNITKDPDHPLPHIDEFINADVEAILEAEFTTVLNQRQIDYLVDEFRIPRKKLKLCQKVLRRSMMQLYTEKSAHHFVPPINGIFFPFRISDPCYKFDEVLEYAKDHNEKLYVTDPNHSLKTDDQNVVVLNLDKLGYYSALRQLPKIVYHENPARCFHPGLAELLHFNSRIISPYLKEIFEITDIYVDEPIYPVHPKY